MKIPVDEGDLVAILNILIEATKRGVDGGRGGINWNAKEGTEYDCAQAIESSMTKSTTCIFCPLCSQNKKRFCPR